MERKIYAAFDAQGIYVYQAFRPEIVDEAVALGTFGKHFNMHRMTWIKPSLGWMLYRSHYASLHNQEKIVRVKLRHEGFVSVLAQAVPTVHETALYADYQDWRRALERSQVRYQWDPDRDLRLRKLDRRALQLGLRGSVVEHYVHEWIVGIEDITPLAHAIRAACENGRHDRLPPTLAETEYPVTPAVQKVLSMGM